MHGSGYSWGWFRCKALRKPVYAAFRALREAFDTDDRELIELMTVLCTELYVAGGRPQILERLERLRTQSLVDYPLPKIVLEE